MNQFTCSHHGILIREKITTSLDAKVRSKSNCSLCEVKWTGNVYTLQGKYICHSFDPPVIIPEGELVCPAKFMTPMIKTSHRYHEPK